MSHPDATIIAATTRHVDARAPMPIRYLGIVSATIGPPRAS